MHPATASSIISDDMSSGHHLKTRAEQERISSFLHDNTRRSNSQEEKSHRKSDNTRHRHRHPLDPVDSGSESDHRSRRHRKQKYRRSKSRSLSSENNRRRRQTQQSDKKTSSSSSRRQQQRRRSSASSSQSSTQSKTRDRKRRNSIETKPEKSEPKPTCTIIMHGIPHHIDEHELLSELSIAKVPVQETRIIHRRDPNTQLQTAYIEFNTVQEAEQWMIVSQGTFLLNDHLVTLTHRFDDDNSTAANHGGDNKDYQRNIAADLRLRDWDCYKCGLQNFKRRDHCYNCHISREDSERSRDLDGYSCVGLNPCNTLVLRGLDILTSKESIEVKLIELTLVTMKNVAIVKDHFTGVSRGFAFVEYSSIHESVLVYETLQALNPPVEIDGKMVIVHFSKNNYSTSLAQIQDDDEAFYSRRSTSSRHRHRHDHDDERSNPNVAQLLPSNTVDRTNTAAEIAQHALQNIHAQKQRDYNRQYRRRNHSSSDEHSHDSSDSSSTHRRSKRRRSSRSADKFLAPDPSKFEWYPDVGYHFDKTTGFYFDAKSSYFYNSITRKYMYWDPAKSTYIPVDETILPVTGNETISTATTAIESKDKTDKVKNAQKVAKEMEQWAKKEREKKEKEAKRKAQAAAAVTDQSSTTGVITGTSSFAEVGLPAIKPVTTSGLLSLHLPSTSGLPAANRPALLTAFDDPNSDDEEDESSTTKQSSTTSTNVLDTNEEKLVDWNKLTCLLCQRQFDTREVLEKHLQMSTLHNENLAKAGIVRSQPLVYRDRAKERRQAFGTDDSSKRKDSSPVYDRSGPSTSSRRMPAHAPPSAPLSTDNIGSKLMKKHGWQEGQGLGKKLQGRADPIEAEMRQQGLGLGADQRLKYQAEPGDSYKDVVRKVARARFSMLES